MDGVWGTDLRALLQQNLESSLPYLRYYMLRFLALCYVSRLLGFWMIGGRGKGCGICLFFEAKCYIFISVSRSHYCFDYGSHFSFVHVSRLCFLKSVLGIVH